MNNQKAKTLRREARRRTVGRPNVSYVDGAAPYIVPVRDSLGLVTGHRKLSHGVPTTLMSGCTRSMYRALKKAAA